MDFIGEYFLEDETVCDKLLDFYMNSPYSMLYRRGGIFGRGDEVVEDRTQKSCTELEIIPEDFYDALPVHEYFQELQKVITKYIEEYPYCNHYSAWKVVESIKIQMYSPGESFSIWHTERAVCHMPSTARHLVFMTYLNTVEEGDGGETEFYHQQKKVRPEKGKTVIWPADWTHTHRGLEASQPKCIITGWFNYV